VAFTRGFARAGCIPLKRLVGARGFEPPTPWSRIGCCKLLKYIGLRRFLLLLIEAVAASLSASCENLLKLDVLTPTNLSTNKSMVTELAACSPGVADYGGVGGLPRGLPRVGGRVGGLGLSGASVVLTSRHGGLFATRYHSLPRSRTASKSRFHVTIALQSAPHIIPHANHFSSQ
jgi:hypothetical protein